MSNEEKAVPDDFRQRVINDLRRTKIIVPELTDAERIAALTAEVDALKKQQSLLVEGIVGAAIEMGVTDGSLPLTGSQLLMIVNDTKYGIAALKAELAETKKMCLELIETRNRYGSLNDELEAELTRLSATITDAELEKIYEDSHVGPSDDPKERDRYALNKFILARATKTLNRKES